MIRRVRLSMLIPVTLVAGIFISLNTALGTTDQDNVVPGVVKNHVVEIEGFTFQPALLKVSVGDTVTWINRDIVPHTATELDGSWDSSSLKSGEQYTLQIPADFPGNYYCIFHPSMKASFILIE